MVKHDFILIFWIGVSLCFVGAIVCHDFCRELLFAYFTCCRPITGFYSKYLRGEFSDNRPFFFFSLNSFLEEVSITDHEKSEKFEKV